MRIKRIISLVLCMIFLLNSSPVWAKEGGKGTNPSGITLEENSGYDYSMTIGPVGTASRIKGVITDSVFKLEKAETKYVKFLPKPSYFIDGDKLYIKKLKNRHTLTLVLNNSKEVHFLYKDGKFKEIDESEKPNKDLHVKLEGYFEGAIVGQKKI